MALTSPVPLYWAGPPARLAGRIRPRLADDGPVTLVRAASAHPRWAAALALAAAVALAVVWYLASPLWVRTYREEALPTAGVFVQPVGTLVPGTPAPSVAPPEPRI